MSITGSLVIRRLWVWYIEGIIKNKGLIPMASSAGRPKCVRFQIVPSKTGEDAGGASGKSGQSISQKDVQTRSSGMRTTSGAAHGTAPVAAKKIIVLKPDPIGKALGEGNIPMAMVHAAYRSYASIRPGHMTDTERKALVESHSSLFQQCLEQNTSSDHGELGVPLALSCLNPGLLKESDLTRLDDIKRHICHDNEHAKIVENRFCSDKGSCRCRGQKSFRAYIGTVLSLSPSTGQRKTGRACPALQTIVTGFNWSL